MSFFNAVFDSLEAFAMQGGAVIWLQFAVCFVLWLLILERILFFRISWPTRAKQLVREWNSRRDQQSWRAQAIREAVVSRSSRELYGAIAIIRTLVALCPLLGLLGTVLGMTGVFDVIASSGNDDAQAMASGIYRATLPTMAGLTVALSGIYFTVRLAQKAEREVNRLRGLLALSDAQPEVVSS